MQIWMLKFGTGGILIAKRKPVQYFILKIHSKRLREARWNLQLDLQDARERDELVTISSSQQLRWINELNGGGDQRAEIADVRRQIRDVTKIEDSRTRRAQLKRLYAQLDKLQYQKDYVCIIIDSEKDYRTAINGFYINGIKYARLLGTNGGIKQNTIVFVNADLVDELRRRIDNGRDTTKELVPAKFEAYRALTCSGSTPVSFPRGIVIVPDCETKFIDGVVWLADSEDGDPTMTPDDNAEIELCASDGCGMMLPSLAERWSKELGLSYTACGMNTRFAWEKGMVFAFDFLEFADKVAGRRTIVDAWGAERDLRNVELVLTTSQVKLWDSYSSMEDYLENCFANKYSFGITKVAEQELESRHSLNYQFIQSYRLTDEQLAELVMPTVNEIHDVLGLDYRKTILYFAGKHIGNGAFDASDSPEAAALMMCPDMINDPHIRMKVRAMITKRIKEAKIGVIDVPGNYTILSGDLYALCQSMFGLPVTGILRRNEIFNRYWLDCGIKKVACFRAPMSCHNNIRLQNICQSDDAAHWYQHMPTVTVLNSWDTTMAALNGADFDGDLVFTTSSSVLVDNIRPTKTLMCLQKKAPKVVISEDALIESNINSFGSAIGQITNWVTSMYDVQANFQPGSREYETLEYRIQCGQKAQQDEIDKSKGIISNSMPAHWHSRRACVSKFKDDEDELQFQLSICADKKPYFMMYVYPALGKLVRKYESTVKFSAKKKFQQDFDAIMQKSADELTEDEAGFVVSATYNAPVNYGECTMNRLCWMVEDQFPRKATRQPKCEFDPSLVVDTDFNIHDVDQKILKRVGAIVHDYGMIIQCKMKEVSFGDESFANWISMALYRQLSGASHDTRLIRNILATKYYSKEWVRCLLWGRRPWNILPTIFNHSSGAVAPVAAVDGEVMYNGDRYSMQPVDLVLHGYNIDEDWGDC